MLYILIISCKQPDRIISIAQFTTFATFNWQNCCTYAWAWPNSPYNNSFPMGAAFYYSRSLFYMDADYEFEIYEM